MSYGFGTIIAPFVAFPKRLRAILEQVNDALKQLGKELSASVKLSRDLLHFLFTRITFVTETLTLALENYANVYLSSRSKRGFVDGLGHFSHFLFGNAMDADVQELRENTPLSL